MSSAQLQSFGRISQRVIPAKAGIQALPAEVLWSMYFVYILASKQNGTLYIGVTNSLERRVAQHKEGTFEGFSKGHGVHRLVYYECFEDIHLAIIREKQLKKLNRAWKLRLIESVNPEWVDLTTCDYQFTVEETADKEGPGFPPSRE